MSEALAARVIETLGERGVNLATSESLTGGLVGATLTGVPGASQVYLGGVIVYDLAMKSRLGGVSKSVLASHGAVSEQTVVEMAVGIQHLTSSDWAIAVTGVAGPGPAQGHPAGEVWICVAGPQIGGQQHRVLRAERHWFEGERLQVRQQTVDAALGLLLTLLSPV